MLGADGTLNLFEINACFQLTRFLPADKRALCGYLEDTNAAVMAALLTLLERRARRDG